MRIKYFCFFFLTLYRFFSYICAYNNAFITFIS